jgi:hypothetical protein
LPFAFLPFSLRPSSSNNTYLTETTYIFDLFITEPKLTVPYIIFGVILTSVSTDYPSEESLKRIGFHYPEPPLHSPTVSTYLYPLNNSLSFINSSTIPTNSDIEISASKITSQNSPSTILTFNHPDIDQNEHLFISKTLPLQHKSSSNYLSSDSFEEKKADIDTENTNNSSSSCSSSSSSFLSSSLLPPLPLNHSDALQSSDSDEKYSEVSLKLDDDYNNNDNDNNNKSIHPSPDSPIKDFSTSELIDHNQASTDLDPSFNHSIKPLSLPSTSQILFYLSSPKNPIDNKFDNKNTMLSSSSPSSSSPSSPSSSSSFPSSSSSSSSSSSPSSSLMIFSSQLPSSSQFISAPSSPMYVSSVSDPKTDSLDDKKEEHSKINSDKPKTNFEEKKNSSSSDLNKHKLDLNKRISPSDLIKHISYVNRRKLPSDSNKGGNSPSDSNKKNSPSDLSKGRNSPSNSRTKIEPLSQSSPIFTSPKSFGKKKSDSETTKSSPRSFTKLMSLTSPPNKLNEIPQQTKSKILLNKRQLLENEISAFKKHEEKDVHKIVDESKNRNILKKNIVNLERK